MVVVVVVVVAFFLACEDFWENVRQFIPCLRLKKKKKKEINSGTLIPPFRPRPVHICSASRDDCDRVFPDELRVSSFPDRFLHYAWTAA